MTQPIFHIQDGFFEDPVAERSRALAAEYEAVEHNGVNYRGIALVDDEPNCAQVESLLNMKLQGPRTVYWRRYLENEDNETYIHSDCQIGAFTAVAFLNPNEQCQGGTAFWRHKKYGWERQPTADEMKAQGLEDTPEFWAKIYQDGFDEENWELLAVAPMKWNRAVIFDSRRFHSRYPKKSFGSEVQDARLVKVFFLKPDNYFAVRQFVAKFDYADVCEWWTARKWPEVPLDHLSTIGAIAQDEKHKYAAVWLYTTNSSFGWLEYFVTNPKAPMKGRKHAIDRMLEKVAEEAKALGVKTLFTTCESKGLIRLFKKHGFTIGDKLMTNLVRRVN